MSRPEQRGDARKAVSIATAARLYEVSPDTIRRSIRADGSDPAIPPLPARRLGQQWRISLRDLDAWWEALPTS